MQKQRKLQSLMLLLTSTFISDEEMNKVLEGNMFALEDNRAVRVLQDRGRKQRDIEIAINMIKDGDDAQKISRITGLELSRIAELQTELQAG